MAKKTTKNPHTYNFVPTLKQTIYISVYYITLRMHVDKAFTGRNRQWMNTRQWHEWLLTIRYFSNFILHQKHYILF